MKLPEGVRAELIEGEILMSPYTKDVHQRVVGNVYAALRGFVQARRLGHVRVAPLDVHLPSGDIVQPDLIFISNANSGILKDWIRGTPDLLVEVLSPEGIDRDRFTKRDLYARNGVPEYWIVDPDARDLEVLSLAGDHYAPHGYFQESDVVTSRAIPELSLPLREVFA